MINCQEPIATRSPLHPHFHFLITDYCTLITCFSVLRPLAFSPIPRFSISALRSFALWPFSSLPGSPFLRISLSVLCHLPFPSPLQLFIVRRLHRLPQIMHSVEPWSFRPFAFRPWLSPRMGALAPQSMGF